MLRSAFETKLLLNTFLVLVLKEFIAYTGVTGTLPDTLSALPIPAYLIFALLFFVGGYYQRHKRNHRAWHPTGVCRDSGWRDAAHGAAHVYVPRRQPNLTHPYLSRRCIGLFSCHAG